MVDFVDKVKNTGIWSDKNIAGTPEIDFVFSNATDFVFSNGQDFVFAQATAAGVWVDKNRV